MTSEMVSAERLNELYEIDLEAGTFYHKRGCGRAKKGSRAGFVSKQGGYRILCVDRKDYFEHNLVWFLTRGEWLPRNGYEVDHINRIRDDNRSGNLRKATRSQNNANMRLRSDNRAGHRGVHFDKEKQKYCVQITVNGKTHTLGYYITAERAAAASYEARKRFFGEFVSESEQ